MQDIDPSHDCKAAFYRNRSSRNRENTKALNGARRSVKLTREHDRLLWNGFLMNRQLFLLVIAFASTAWAVQNRAQGRPPAGERIGVILDTDLDSDVDDVGALALLHALADSGEAEILAVIVTSDDMYAPSCADAINTYFGHPDIPIGVDPRQSLRVRSRYTKGVAEAFEHDLKRYSDAADAVEVYRQVLAKSRDSSVAIVTVGHLTNLRRLLDSESDAFSKLDGEALVAAKVRLWSCMGGKYPAGKEPNFYRPDSESTVQCVGRWPGAVVFSGAEIGNPIKTGGQLFKQRAPQDGPAYLAYQLYNDFRGRSSWDQTAVLYAVRGCRDYWTLHSEGHNHVFSDGSNEWRDKPDKDHAYLIEKMPPDELARIIERLMVHEP